MATLQETVDRATAMLAQSRAEGSKPFAGSSYDTYKPVTPNLTFDASSLSGATPYTLPQGSTANNSAAGTGAFIKTSVLDTYQQQRADEIASLEKDTKGEKSAITKLYEKLGSKSQRQEDIYAAQGVDDKRREVDSLTSQIEAEQVSLAHRVEDIEKNPEGKLASGIQEEVSRVTRQSVRTQADLAVVQAAATRNYSTAAAIADRQLEAEFEPITAKLDYLKYFYSENRDSLTKKQDQQYQEYITGQNRAYQESYDQKKLLQDSKLKMLESASAQNAPVSVLTAIQAATTPEAALAAAGKYGSDILDRQLKLAQIAATNRSNQPSDSESSAFTKSEKNAGAQNAGVNLDDFNRMSYDAQNFFVNGKTDLKTNTDLIDSELDGGTDASELEGRIANNGNLPHEVKDYLTKYLYQVSPGK